MRVFWKIVAITVRLALFLVAVAAALPQAPSICARVLPSLSPFLVLGAAIAARTAGIWTLLCVPLIVAALARKRPFCRYACPTGFMLELAGKLSRTRGSGNLSRVPLVGRGIVAVALGGAVFGFPIVLWLDPLALFNGAVNAFHPPPTALSWLPAAGLIVLVLLSIWRPGIWCYRTCPLGAVQESLYALKNVAAPPRKRVLPGRRAFLAAAVGGTAAMIARRFSAPHVIRPPGAVSESHFNATCVRCGNCIRACPERILRIDTGESGVAGLLTPIVRFGPGYCREECDACGAVCPTGAIAHLSPEQKRTAVMGIAAILKEHCVSWADQETCMSCIDACPYEAFKIVERNHVECPVVDESKCVGCGACEFVCPARTLAVKVRPV